MSHIKHKSRCAIIMILTVLVLSAVVCFGFHIFKLDYTVVGVQEITDAYRDVNLDTWSPDEPLTFSETWSLGDDKTNQNNNFDVTPDELKNIMDNSSDYCVMEIEVNVYNPHIFCVWQTRIKPNDHSVDGVWFQKSWTAGREFLDLVCAKNQDTVFINCIVSNQLKDRFDVDFINENFSFSVKGKFYPSFARYRTTE